MTTLEKILFLTKQLYPTGRAFRGPIDSDFDLLRRALALSEARAFDDAKSTLSSLLPDNDVFSEDDATDWERRLGLISNTNVAFADRKAAITRKIQHPGEIEARQHYTYIQRELRAAGFDVYVYENRFDYGDGTYYTKTPAQFSLIDFPTISIQHETILQHGDAQHGGDFGNKIANHIESELDDAFDVGSSYRSTFFIGYTPAGTWASLDADREYEFRQLVLKLKPQQTVAFILINFNY